MSEYLEHLKLVAVERADAKLEVLDWVLNEVFIIEHGTFGGMEHEEFAVQYTREAIRQIRKLCKRELKKARKVMEQT